jgi:hypothetical protein
MKNQNQVEYRKEYYRKNREKFLNKEPCCFCGKIVCRSAMINHLKSSNCMRVQDVKRKNAEIKEKEKEDVNLKDMIITLTKVLTRDDLTIEETSKLISITNKLLETYLKE